MNQHLSPARDRDFAPRESARTRAAGRRPAEGGILSLAAGLAGSAIGLLLAAAARRPAFVLAGVAVIGGAGVFSWNATMRQPARHPAPLFASAKPSPAPAPEPQRRAEAPAPATTGATRPDLPAPPPRPANADAIGSILRAEETSARPPERAARPGEARAKTAERPAETKPAAPRAKPADGTADKPVPKDARPAPQARVSAAQKALAKLGYGPIAADGLLGAGTRQAIERFEREKNLPVTGTLEGRTLKKLASLSGMPIE